jgi:hypothetical protein
MDCNKIAYAAFDILRDNLYAFLDFKLQAIYGEEWRPKACKKAKIFHSRNMVGFDILQLNSLLHTHYSEIFQDSKGSMAKDILKIIKFYRNRVMHQHLLRPTEAYRVLDLMVLFLDNIKLRDKTIINYRRDLLKYLYEHEFSNELPLDEPYYEDLDSTSDFNHYYVPVPESQCKADSLLNILKKTGHRKVIIYCDSRSDYDVLEYCLCNQEWDLICLDNTTNTHQFDQIMRILRSSNRAVLLYLGVIITKGMLENISLVINYEIPRDYMNSSARLDVLDVSSQIPEVINFIQEGDMDAIRDYEHFSSTELKILQLD